MTYDSLPPELDELELFEKRIKNRKGFKNEDNRSRAHRRKNSI